MAASPSVTKALVFLKHVPAGLPILGTHFAVKDVPLATTLPSGSVRFRLTTLSVDPYMRGRMKDIKSYTPGYAIGKPGAGGAIAVVEKSENAKYPVGSRYVGTFDWVHRFDLDEDALQQPQFHPLPKAAKDHESWALGVLGMPGATAYFGVHELLKPQANETGVVSGAAGAVGHLVVQILKLRGLKVVGFAGSDDKIEYLKELGVDAAINYREEKDIKSALEKAAPSGVDVYFDNVGGEIADAVTECTNTLARIAACGAVANYNEESAPMRKNLERLIITRQLTICGFICTRWLPRWNEAFDQLGAWLQEGKLHTIETVLEGGIEDIVPTFNKMMQGGELSKGKMLLRLKDD